VAAAFKNKVCLKEMKISRYWRHPITCDDVTGSYSRTGVPEMFPTAAAGSIVGLAKRTAAEREHLLSDPSQ
jgi:hypothetical protein